MCCESNICHNQKLRIQKDRMQRIIIMQITYQKAIEKRQCDEGAEIDVPSLNQIWLVNKTKPKGVR